MAGIETYLDLIKNAVYGREVRQAIHDGIHQCYEDGKAGAVDLEARERIDQIIAPSGEAPSAAEVADGRIVDGVTYSLIGDAIRSVDAEIKDSYDTFDYTETAGYFADNGSIQAQSSYYKEVYTNRFDVVEGETLKVSMVIDADRDQWVAYMLYDSKGNKVMNRQQLVTGHQKRVEGTVTIPENAVQIAFTYRSFGVVKGFTCRGYYDTDGINDINKNAVENKSIINKNLPILSGSIDIGKAMQGAWGIEGLNLAYSRLALGLFYISGTITASVSDYTSYKFAVVKYNKTTGARVSDSGWRTADYTFDNTSDCCFGIVLAKVGDSSIEPVELDDVGFSMSSTGYYQYPAEGTILEANRKELNEILPRVDTSYNPMRFSGLYDHLFVDRTDEYSFIPHQSLFHVRLSRKLGFNVIEANVNPTSDGVFVVNHLISGKFGGYFHHVDGRTNISNTYLSSVTWNWVVDNVRYNSAFPKLRTRPPRLEEFLAECKQQNIIPLINTTNLNVIKMTEDIMGKGNYIAYMSNRVASPNAIIYHWKSLPSKEAILKHCESVGAPFIYGMSNPTDFSDTELKDIVKTLHENGFMIGCSYADKDWWKYRYFGFDVNGTQMQVNRIKNANICNYNSLLDFDDFEYTNASVNADGHLVFSSNGTLVPKMEDKTYLFAGLDVEVEYSGSITFESIGEFSQDTVTSDGTFPYFTTAFVLNSNPKMVMRCTSGTVIKNISYLATEF